jgi:hypothetical protein
VQRFICFGEKMQLLYSFKETTRFFLPVLYVRVQCQGYTVLSAYGETGFLHNIRDMTGKSALALQQPGGRQLVGQFPVRGQYCRKSTVCTGTAHVVLTRI